MTPTTDDASDWTDDERPDNPPIPLWMVVFVIAFFLGRLSN